MKIFIFVLKINIMYTFYDKKIKLKIIRFGFSQQLLSLYSI